MQILNALVVIRASVRELETLATGRFLHQRDITIHSCWMIGR